MDADRQPYTRRTAHSRRSQVRLDAGLLRGSLIHPGRYDRNLLTICMRHSRRENITRSVRISAFPTVAGKYLTCEALSYPGVSVNHRRRYAEHVKAIVTQSDAQHFHERCLQLKAIPSYIKLADTKGAADFELKYLIESFAISVIGLDPGTQKQKQYEDVKKMEDPNDAMPDDVFPANREFSICAPTKPTQQCDLCDDVFETAWQKRAHRLIVHDASDYECPFCDKRYQLACRLREHAARHLPATHKCLDDNCQKSFHGKWGMLLHYASAHAVDVIQCPADGCEETFRAHGSTSPALRKHFQKEHEEHTLSCTRGCGKMFCLQSLLTKHDQYGCRLRTAEDKEATKETCGLGDCTVTIDRGSIYDHRGAHDKCTHCQQILPFVVTNNLNGEALANVKESARRAHFLDHCSNRPLDIDGDLRAHFESATGKKVLHCYLHPSCRYDSTNRYNFDQHQATHDKCTRCDYHHSIAASGKRYGKLTPPALILREEHTKDCVGLSAEVRETARLQYERKNAPRTPLASINANAPPKTKQSTLSFGTVTASNKKRKLD